MRRAVIVVLVLAVVLAACGKKQETGEEPMTPQPNIPRGDLADGTNVPEVMPGDRVYLELTVYHPRYVYLSGKVPVSVLPPGVPGLVFEKTQYDMTSPSFPMIIPFEVTREVARAPVTLRVGLRVSYANKAVNSEQVRHEMLNVPLVVTKRTTRKPKIVHLPLEHYLQVDQEAKR